MLAYHYLKTAAYQYEMKDAYYYLTIIEFMKLVPTTTIKRNLEDQQSKGNKDYLQMKNVINYMNSSHLNNVEHDLYLSSLLGHRGATLTLAYMLKEGIGMEKNCSASLSYYLYSLK